MIEVDTRSYENMNGEQPRGRSHAWMFRFEVIAHPEKAQEVAAPISGAHADSVIFGVHDPVFHAKAYSSFSEARKQARTFAKGIGARRITLCTT